MIDRCAPRDLLDEPPPHDREAERAVLGCILLDPARLPDVRRRIPLVAYFYDSSHQAIFRAMRKVAERGARLDVTLLAAELGNSGASQPVADLLELVERVPHAVNVGEYADRVADCAARRAVRETAFRLLQSAHAGESIGSAINATSEALTRIAKRCGDDGAESRPVLVPLADVQPESVCWLWPGRIALGKLTLLVGDPGLGKSFLSIDLAARVTRAAAWPDDTDSAAPLGGVVLLNAEDDLADTVRPRLDAAGAKVERVTALQAVRDAGGVERAVCLTRDLAAIERAIQSTPDCRLVVIDPITAYLGSIDSHKNADVRGLLAPLGELASRHRVAMVAVTHLNKGGGSNPLYRAMGSLGFVAAARAAWLVARDPDDKDRRLFLPTKNNLGPDDHGMAFRIVDSRLEWEAEPVLATAAEMLSAEPATPSASKLDAAAEWLRDELASGPVSQAELERLARESGHTWGTIRRAKRRLGVEARKDGFGGAGGWIWELPADRCAENPKDAQVSEVSAFGKSAHLCDSVTAECDQPAPVN